MTIDLKRRQMLLSMGVIALPACTSIQPARLDAQVIVLGAGIAGLTTARILAAQGVDVLVLEASDRIGGRLYTLDTGDGRFSEAGGQEVGGGYARVRNAARELGLEIPDYSGPALETLLNVQGNNLSVAQWAKSPDNPFPDELKSIAPGSVLGRLAFKENPLDSVYAWATGDVGDISAYDWLRAKGLNDQALAMADHTLNANDLKSYSMLNFFRSLALFTQDTKLGKSGYIQGGAQRLPEAMAAALQRPVKTNQRVSAIDVQDSRVRVETTNGIFHAERVVCALPFPALAKINLRAPVLDTQRDAINGLPYTQIMQVHFRADNAFWEQDGLPAQMWTDGPFERLFARKGLDHKPDGFFRAWVNGTATASLSRLSDARIAEMLSNELRRLRPMSKGDIKVNNVIRWTNDNSLAGGAYMHFAPSQVSKWKGSMGLAADRLHFAGEHLSAVHTGFEGAMESGEVAALEILTA